MVWVPVSIQRADLEAGKKPDKAAGAQAHQRTVASLQKQIGMQEKKCQEVSGCGHTWVGVVIDRVHMHEML